MYTKFAAVLAGTAMIIAGGLTTIESSGAALPAPPDNDDIANATPITSIPASSAQDTSEATSVTTDGECVYGKSVWYRYRPAANGWARLTTLGSAFDTVLAVFVGPRGARQLIRCNDDAIGLDSAVRVRFETERRYWIAISSCCRRSSRAGGAAQLHAYLPAPLGGEVIVATAETGGTSGRLFLSGTAECNTPTGIFVAATVSQRVGANVARGNGEAFVECLPGEMNAWRLRVDSTTDWAFQPGSPVAVSLNSVLDDGFGFAEDDQELTITPTDNPTARTSP
jgi:hypothetical protein